MAKGKLVPILRASYANIERTFQASLRAGWNNTSLAITLSSISESFSFIGYVIFDRETSKAEKETIHLLHFSLMICIYFWRWEKAGGGRRWGRETSQTKGSEIKTIE